MADDLERLAHDLSKAGAVTTQGARAVVAKGALNIKNDWREGWKGLAHAPLLPLSIGYDVTVRRNEISAEIGPDKGVVVGGGKHRTPGNLGNLIEFGSVKNAPNPAGQKALDREEPGFVQAMENIAGKIL